jgi:hypothetical protein
MSKKRRLKLEKIKKDSTLTENEKEQMISQISGEGMGQKRVKRS